jgi:hypothetical protein
MAERLIVFDSRGREIIGTVFPAHGFFILIPTKRF